MSNPRQMPAKPKRAHLDAGTIWHWENLNGNIHSTLLIYVVSSH